MNNSICIFLPLQCDTGPSHVCNYRKILSPNFIQSKRRVQAGAREHWSGGKVWKSPAFQSETKEKSHHPTSEVRSEADLRWIWAAAGLSVPHQRAPALLCHPLKPLPCIAVQSHGHNYNNFSLLHDTSTSVSRGHPLRKGPFSGDLNDSWRRSRL